MADRERIPRAAAPAGSNASRGIDDVSEHLGQVLRRADQLLAEWSRFGDAVRAQVDREAGAIGDAVAAAAETAATRGVSASVDRALAAQFGPRLASLADELGKLEARTRAVTRSLGDHRASDRRMWWVVIAGVIVANALLVALLVRTWSDRSDPAPLAPPAMAEPAPEPVEVPSPSVVPDTAPPPPPAPAAAAPEAGSAVAPEIKSAPSVKHAPAVKTYGAPVKRS